MKNRKFEHLLKYMDEKILKTEESAEANVDIRSDLLIDKKEDLAGKANVSLHGKGSFLFSRRCRSKKLILSCIGILIAGCVWAANFKSSSLGPSEISLESETDSSGVEYLSRGTFDSANSIEEEEEEEEVEKANCYEAKRRCNSECDSPITLDNGDYIYSSDSNFNNLCEDACQKGENACEHLSKEEGCDQFVRNCNRGCPSEVEIYSQNERGGTSNALSQCEDACRAGARSCE